ncbi:MAG: prevent-host-death protein [Actinobacteria bacterium]|nr:prevent-host-death protein [Actinomycetota bacterium]MBM3712121.1 prevent-host-death protein [Actinomycetota bacterium]
MVESITANELKTKGLSALSRATLNDNEAIITVRGKNKYVVIPFDRYNYLRECELESALGESIRDMNNGRYIEETVENHIRRITSG